MPKGVVYDYKNRNLPERLHRWFISYNNAVGLYVEENFDTRSEANARMKELKKEQIVAYRWTRERSIPESRLR